MLQQTKSLWSEFKAFAFKGSMIDLAIAFVIGAAFQAVIKSMVDNIIMPLVSYVTPNMHYYEWHIGKLTIGKFIADLISFVAVAMAVFIVIVKLMGSVVKRATGPAAPSEPVTKECPMCTSIIPIKARKCPQCTADIAAV
jgi:large conductance mechanosensitive channel